MISSTLKNLVRKGGSIIFGHTPRIHRIPFGPIKGWNIFMSFDISPRMYFGIDEPWIAKLAQQYIKPADVVYDIGSHIGYTTLLFLQRVGKSGSVQAFEILRSVAHDYFQRTMDANKVKNAIVYPVGLSKSDQSVELPIGETLMTSLFEAGVPTKQRTELCSIVRLDGFVKREQLPVPSLIKIDIEGAEVDCLLGGLDLIKKHLPVLIVEFHTLDLLTRGHSLLRSLGYFLKTQEYSIDQQQISKLTSFHQSVLCLPSNPIGSSAKQRKTTLAKKKQSSLNKTTSVNLPGLVTD